MKSKKLVVMFPGIGYHCDKPLLYYSRDIARDNGYDCIEIKYDLPVKAKDVKDNKEKKQDVFNIAAKQANEQLSVIDFSEYEKVLFVGKSLGTVVAAYCDREMKIGARHIVFTPVPGTFEYLRKGCGVVFHGTSDPWCETKLVMDKCSELELDLITVGGANHSLEVKDTLENIRTIEMVMERVKKEM